MGKYALVTGGSRGIGREVCVRLAKMGYNVVINYVSNDAQAEQTAALVRECGVEAELLKFDVSDNEAAVAAIEATCVAIERAYCSLFSFIAAALEPVIGILILQLHSTKS